MTLSGVKLAGTTSVVFPAAQQASFTTNSDTAIAATVPSIVASGKITLATTYGSTISSARFSIVPPPVAAVGAVSRKTHVSAGAFDVPLPLTGSPGIECRSGGGSGNHQVIVTFAKPVIITNASITAGTDSVSSSSVNGSQVTLNLTGVTNAQRLTLKLIGVNDGTTTNDVAIPMAVLAGDTTGDGTVNSADVSQVKSQSGQSVAGTNFREDLTVDGSINSAECRFCEVVLGNGSAVV